MSDNTCYIQYHHATKRVLLQNNVYTKYHRENNTYEYTHLIYVQVKVVNRSKRDIEFELVDAQDLGVGRLEGKGVRFVPALPTTLGPRERTMVEVRAA